MLRPHCNLTHQVLLHCDVLGSWVLTVCRRRAHLNIPDTQRDGRKLRLPLSSALGYPKQTKRKKKSAFAGPSTPKNLNPAIPSSKWFSLVVWLLVPPPPPGCSLLSAADCPVVHCHASCLLSPPAAAVCRQCMSDFVFLSPIATNLSLPTRVVPAKH